MSLWIHVRHLEADLYRLVISVWAFKLVLALPVEFDDYEDTSSSRVSLQSRDPRTSPVRLFYSSYLLIVIFVVLKLDLCLAIPFKRSYLQSQFSSLAVGDFSANGLKNLNQKNNQHFWLASFWLADATGCKEYFETKFGLSFWRL